MSAKGRHRGYHIFEAIGTDLPVRPLKVRPKPTFGKPVKPDPVAVVAAPVVASASSEARDLEASAPAAHVPGAAHFLATSPAVSRMEALFATMEACDLAARYGRVLPHLDEALASLFGDDAWTAHLERSGSAVRGVDPEGLPLRDFSPSVARYRWSGASGLVRGPTPSWRPAPPSVAMASFHGPLHPVRRPGSPGVLWGPFAGAEIQPPSARDVGGRSPFDVELCMDSGSASAAMEAALLMMNGLRPGGALRGAARSDLPLREEGSGPDGRFAVSPSGFGLLAFDAVRGNDAIRRQTWIGTPGRGEGPPDRAIPGTGGTRREIGAEVRDPRRADGIEALLGLMAATPSVVGGDEGDRVAPGDQGGELVVAALETVMAMLASARALEAQAFTPATPRFRIRAAAHLVVAGVTAAMRNGGERRWGLAALPTGGAREDGLPAYAPIPLGPVELVAMLRDLQVMDPSVAMAGYRPDELAEGWEWLRWTAFARVAVEAARFGFDPPGGEMAWWGAGVVVPPSGPASCRGLVPRILTRIDDPSFLDPSSLKDASGRNEGHACALLRRARADAGISDPASDLLQASWTNGALDLGEVENAYAASVGLGRPENGFLRPFDRRLREEGPLDHRARDRGRLAGVLNRRERQGLEPIAPRVRREVEGLPVLPENDAFIPDGDPIRVVPIARVAAFRKAVGIYRLEPSEEERRAMLDDLVTRLAVEPRSKFTPRLDPGDHELADPALDLSEFDDDGGVRKGS